MPIVSTIKLRGFFSNVFDKYEDEKDSEDIKLNQETDSIYNIEKKERNILDYFFPKSFSQRDVTHLGFLEKFSPDKLVKIQDNFLKSPNFSNNLYEVKHE